MYDLVFIISFFVIFGQFSLACWLFLFIIDTFQNYTDCIAKCNVKGALEILFISPVVLLVDFTVYPSATLSEPKKQLDPFKNKFETFKCHSWEPVLRTMPPASAFRHPASQSGTEEFRYRTGPQKMSRKSYKQTREQGQHLKNTKFAYCYAYNFFRKIFWTHFNVFGISLKFCVL